MAKKSKGSGRSISERFAEDRKDFLNKYMTPAQEKGVKAEWKNIGAEWIALLVMTVSEYGGATLLGHSKSGDQFCIMVYFGADKVTQYFPATDAGMTDLTCFIDEFTTDLKDD